jgi:HK97 gp10 family phage protein
MAEETGIRLTANIPGLEDVREQFLAFGKNYAAKYIASALKNAAEKGGTREALKNATPRGRTGNLKRSVAVKTKRYVRQGTGVAIIGYKSGRKMNEPYDNTKLGYHQGLVEFGTKERFRRTEAGLRVSTGKMPVGGSYGRPPVRTAWQLTRSRVEGMIVEEMKKALEAAAREMAAYIKSRQGPF